MTTATVNILPFSRRGRKRRRAIEELLSTEKTYVHLMTKLVADFVIFLRSNTYILSTEDHKVLFPSDIHAILGLNRTFLSDLTKVIESQSFNNENTKIGDIIYAFCPLFKMYQHYLNNYQYAATKLCELRKKPTSAFCIFCDKQQEKKYFDNLPLESLIILPIQRMPRYKMLLEEIIKNTEADHPDLKQLQNALNKISEVNNSINNKMKEFDQRTEVQNIENRFYGKITNLVTPSRIFLKQGALCKIEKNDDQYYLFVLFNDCILYAEQSTTGDRLIFGNLLKFNSKFKINKTSPDINTNKIQHLFEIHSTNESFMLYAENKHSMNEWINAISDAYNYFTSLPSSIHENEKKIFAKTLFIPNDFTEKCMLTNCSVKFSMVNRRHHCRFCGWVVCSKCSSRQLQSKPNKLKQTSRMVRVCDNCYNQHTSKKHTALSSKSSSIWDAAKLINNKVYDFAKAEQEELIKQFEKRVQTVEENEHRRMSLKESDITNINDILAESKSTSYSSVTSVDMLMPTPAPQKRRQAVMKFVKLDVEPKIIELLADKKNLQRKVSKLESENENLKKKIAALERKLKKKDALIKNWVDEPDTPKMNHIAVGSLRVVPMSPMTLSPTGLSGLSRLMIPVGDSEMFSSDDETERKVHEVREIRFCATCNRTIIGRALKTKDGLHHKGCLVCNECTDPLPGKKYTIVFISANKSIKLCEKCSNDAENENVQKQFEMSLDRRQTFCTALALD